MEKRRQEMIVIDCSIIIAGLLKEETDYADFVIEKLMNRIFVGHVPSLFF